MRILITTLLLLCAGCEKKPPHYVLMCEIGGGLSGKTSYWEARDRIIWDADAQAWNVDGTLVPQGGAMCRTWYDENGDWMFSLEEDKH